MMEANDRSPIARSTAARIFLAMVGLSAMAWAVTVIPRLSFERDIVTVGKAVESGETFKPEVLVAVDARVKNENASMLRPSALGKAALISLRLAELAVRTGDTDRVNRSLESLSEIIDKSLQSAPHDSFLWLARFWLRNTRSGFLPEQLRDLKMSYELGPYEGWIAARRDGLALAVFSSLSKDLADRAISEFVELVRWGLVTDAANIAAGPGKPLRALLFPRLKDLSHDQRRPFAQLLYRRDLDDVLVPGIEPPSERIPMPVLPPGF